MKYPVLHIDYVPELHKAFSKPVVLHFHGTCKDKKKQAYMQYVLKNATFLLTQQFLSNQAVIVELQDQYFILCKDNIDEHMLKHYANELLTIIKEYGKEDLEFTFGYTKAMLMVEGHNIGILNSNKVGENYLQSKEYLTSLTLVKGDDKNPKLYMLKSYEDYQK